MRQLLLTLPRSRKILIGLLFDTAAVNVCLWLAFYIRMDTTNSFVRYPMPYLIATVIALPVFVRSGLYSSVLRHIGLDSIIMIFKACSYSILCLMLAGFLFGQAHLPRSIPFIYWLLLLPVMSLSRYFMRSWLLGQALVDFFPEFFPRKNRRTSHGVSVAIYGAGAAGVQLMSALDRGLEYHPVAFLDEKKDNIGRSIQGRKIYSPQQFHKMIQESGAQEILLAIPSATRARRRDIVQKLEEFGFPIRTVPALTDLASGHMKMQEIQHVDIGDILGRDEVSPREELLEKCIFGKVVMVTGAGGSIGSELCRQILQQGPLCLVLYEHCEFNLYSVEQDLLRIHKKVTRAQRTQIASILGSVTNPERLIETMRRFSVDTVYHAAAYKHVPMVEHNVEEGLRNNTEGTLYTAQASIITHVERFVLISTDKAVRPTNVMGASKRMAEMALQAMAAEQEISFYHAERFGVQKDEKLPVTTCFTMVRFGNVLGSSGSVIPLFREQIRIGEAVTVTHPDINRYFMTIPEAALLVIQAGAMAQGGDVFVLDMGAPVKIVELAKRMIQLSGLTVRDENNLDGDIEIVFSGLRPGEKLYEELLIGDNVTGTSHPKISMAMESKPRWIDYIDDLSQSMEASRRKDFRALQSIMTKIVSGFKASSEVMDWLYASDDNEPFVSERQTLRSLDARSRKKRTAVCSTVVDPLS